VQTALVRITGIGGADVLVIAVRRIAADAGASAAFISLSASAGIIAVDAIVIGVDTAVVHVARVGCTDITVVAVGGRATKTLSFDAGIVQSTGVRIVAATVDGVVATPFKRQTIILRANVHIVAVSKRRANAEARSAEVIFGARVVVVAPPFLWSVNALPIEAGIRGARIVVFAIYREAWFAESQSAFVAGRAGV